MSATSTTSNDDFPSESQCGERSSLNTTPERNLSGSLIAKVPYLKPAEDNKLRASYGFSEQRATQASPAREGGIAATMPRPRKVRSRKGSLRKKVLIGGNNFRTGLDSTSHGSAATPRAHVRNTDIVKMPSPRISHAPADPRIKGAIDGATTNSHATTASSYDSSGGSGNERTSSLPDVAKTPVFGDMSTTDDEEGLQPARKSSFRYENEGGPYHTSKQGVIKRRSLKNPKSPLSVGSAEFASKSEEWDYSETEWWGWIILVITWLVFVVGMGSCFGIWSWAWDVGKAPDTVPELENDATLPIEGYYPALIILTGVMAWVWVMVAWVGMKYFKHAKIPG